MPIVKVTGHLLIPGIFTKADSQALATKQTVDVSEIMDGLAVIHHVADDIKHATQRLACRGERLLQKEVGLVQHVFQYGHDRHFRDPVRTLRYVIDNLGKSSYYN